MKNQFPADKHARITNAHLARGGVAVVANDWMASPDFVAPPVDAPARPAPEPVV